MARLECVVVVVLLFVCTIALGQEEDSVKEPFYDQISRAVIRLEYEEVVQQEQARPQRRIETGTGFFVRSGRELFIVSARHVVEKEHDLSSRVRLVDLHTGSTRMCKLELPRDAWVYHPNNGDEDTRPVDVATMKLRVPNPYLPRYFHYEPNDPNDPNATERNQLPSVDEQPPEPILVFGFPSIVGFQLSEQRPLARLGIMSMSAGKEFLKWDADGVMKFGEERCCLIDARMFGGNSGSPVIRQMTLGKSKVRLLGLVIATNRELDFGIMEPVSRIRETLDVAKAKAAAGSWTLIPEQNTTIAEPNRVD